MSVSILLISDPYLSGGGYHEIKNGGVLKVHADFNRHPSLDLDRRVNLLLYLNKNWKEALKHEKKLMKVDIHHKKNDESMLNYYIAMDYKSKDDPLKKEQAYFDYDLRF